MHRASSLFMRDGLSLMARQPMSLPTRMWCASSPALRQRRDPMQESIVLQLEGLGVRIAGAEILHNVSLVVPHNSFVALVGRNGAGKTTLMRSVMNLIPQSSGQVTI